MISKQQLNDAMKALLKSTSESIPSILEVIPETALAGRVLNELIKAAEKVNAAAQLSENQPAANQGEDEWQNTLRRLIKEAGGETEFKKKLREELKAACDSKNPRFINCASFFVYVGDRLSTEEQEKIVDTLTGELEAETTEIEEFVGQFRREYFGDNYDACDNAIEIEESYISFNFNDAADLPYDENDLAEICKYLNQIAGREVFDDYAGWGTDDLCGY